LLKLDRRSERVHGATKLNHAPVARQPDHPPAAACGSWSEPSVQMFQKPRNGAALIPAYQARRSNRVGKKDRHQFALLTRQRYSAWMLTESVGVLCWPGNRPDGLSSTLLFGLDLGHRAYRADRSSRLGQPTRRRDKFGSPERRRRVRTWPAQT